MLTAYVIRGLKAGLVAGLVFGLLLALAINPLAGAAEAMGHGGESAETDHSAAEAGHGHEGGLLADPVSDGISVLSGVLWGVLLGGVVFGVVFYFLEPAIPGRGAAKSAVLAAAGFVTVSGAPWLVLPPQPPGAEQALATEPRLLLYGGMMVAGAIVCALVALVFTRLRYEQGRSTAVAAAVALLPFGLLAVPVVLAPPNPVEHSLPGGLASGLVGLTVFGQVLCWGVMAAVHARLHSRAASTERATTEGVRAGEPHVAAD